MEVLALMILVIGSTAGLGSGPYLPSGWKPAGPTFYLPTEMEKPVAIPLKEVPLQETETSGSSFLREYGPPDVQVQVEETEADKIQEEVSQDITQQALPELITEQAFVVIEAKSVSDNEENAEINEEVVTEQITSVAETATATESQNIKEQTTESEALVVEAEVESQTESSLIAGEEATKKLVEVNEAEKIVEEVEKNVEEVDKIVEESAVTQEAGQLEITQQYTEYSNSNIVAAIEQKSVEVAELKTAEEGVKNIEEALINLENEIKAQITEAVSEVKTLQGTVQPTPEGFLEYGPPGFTEYGPPKGLAIVAEEKVSTNEINETRRRRFSPKFKTSERKN